MRVAWACVVCAWVSTSAIARSDDANLDAGACRRYLDALDREASANGVVDAQAARINGYPFLRTDRLLASFPPGALDAKGFADWLSRLQALDVDGRRVELANLPQGTREALASRFHLAQDPGTLAHRADRCGSLLRSQVEDSPDLRVDLWERAQVPDAYLGWQRVVGLYPLSQIPFALGITAWQRATLDVFAEPLERLPVRGELVYYGPLEEPAVGSAASAARLEAWDRNPLRIPDPPSGELHNLLVRYAPVLVVDIESNEDGIGAMELDEARRSQVATEVPVVYAYASHARWQGTLLLQINYVFWFPSRPPEGEFDLLTGHLDGVTWRLTLAPDGTVLVADTIHNCGCYHLFFPSKSLRPVAYGAAVEERPFVPQYLPSLRAGERLALRMASRSHYIQRVTAVSSNAAAGRKYALQPYDVLRSLPAGASGRGSLFGSDGIVPGTERLERLLFWPMGVTSAGAMRQRGHHATAFVGRRHFDDPWLIERSFAPVGP